MNEQETALPMGTGTVTDPVSVMEVAADAPLRVTHAGKDYRFCSQHCLEQFEADPERYAVPAPGRKAHAQGDAAGACCIEHPALSPQTPSAGGITYTCPMHPEIRQQGPGTCPKCGMALEPRTVALDEPNEELIDMTRRFWVSTALALPLFVLAMVADLAPDWLPEGVSMGALQWIQFALTTPVVLWGGWPFFVRGWQSLLTWNLNMFTLIGLGVAVAWGYSVVALLFSHLFPPAMRMAEGTVHVYFEAAAVITALVLLGQVLELRARGSTNAAIKLLLGLAPNTARLVRDDGTEVDVDLNEVEPRCDRHVRRLTGANPVMAPGRGEHVGEGKGARRNSPRALILLCHF